LRRWKLAFALAFTILVGLGVWYVVTTLSPQATEERAQAQPAGPMAPARRAIRARALPPRGIPACGGHCGSERWLVKTLSDPDRERVKLEPVDVTIDQLVGLHQPPGGSDVTRAAPVELTLYRVEARLIALFGENDGDFHLVLASPRDPTVTRPLWRRSFVAGGLAPAPEPGFVRRHTSCSHSIDSAPGKRKVTLGLRPCRARTIR
jgi:hypothetical protein